MADRLRSMQITIAITGALAVMLGAFGSHGLKEVLEPSRLQIWTTGIQYQFYHLVLMSLAMWQYDRSPRPIFLWSFRLACLGIVLFSGSLYLLATRDILDLGDSTWLGPLTPIGGVCLIVGWILLAIGAYRGRS